MLPRQTSLRCALLIASAALGAGACSQSQETTAMQPPAVTDAASDDVANDAKPDAAADAGADSADAAGDVLGDALADVAEDAEFDASDDAPATDAGVEDADDAGDGDVASDADTPDGASAMAESVCYFGDFEVDGLAEVACLTWPGPWRSKLDLRGLTGGYAIDAIARTIDGRKMAVAGRLTASDPARVVIYPLDGTGAPLVVATAPAADRTISNLAFASDGMTLAFLADFDLAGSTGLYVVAAQGGAPRRVSPAPIHPNLDVIDYAWSRGAGSRSWLAFVGDIEEDGVFALWTIDTSKPSPALATVVPTASLTPDRDVQAGVQWDSSDRVYYRTNELDSHVWRVHSADKSGADVRVETDLVNANGQESVHAFGLSRAGDRLAFSADGPVSGPRQMFVMPLHSAAPAPAQVSSIPLATGGTASDGPTAGQRIRWNAADTTLACMADWRLAAADAQHVLSAWTLSAQESAATVRVLGAPQSVDSNVRDVAFSRVGNRLFVRGDLLTEGVFELFSTDDPSAPEQDLTAHRVQEAPAGGDVLGLERMP